MTGLSRSMFVWVGVPWVIAVMVGTAASQDARDHPFVTQAKYDRWLTELSNCSTAPTSTRSARPPRPGTAGSSC